MATQESVFLNTRVRLQRLSDAKFFSGWVREFTRTNLIVRMSAPVVAAVGEMYMAQVHGHTCTALFKAMLTANTEDVMGFAIPEPVRFLTASEQVRVSVQGVTAKVTTQDKALEARVMDLSAKGAGLVTSKEIPRGERIRLQFSTPLGDVECSAEVRYCKPESIDEGTFRVGLLLDEMGRIERARWARLVEQDAA